MTPKPSEQFLKKNQQPSCRLLQFLSSAQLDIVFPGSYDLQQSWSYQQNVFNIFPVPFLCNSQSLLFETLIILGYLIDCSTCVALNAHVSFH